jgi:hypothetical protein
MTSRFGNTLTGQIRRNAVALISLVIAITSLTYNTWRNEESEANRTQRAVAMEILMRLGELQQVVWHHHYDKDFEGRGNLRDGWTYVLVIRDIATVLERPVPQTAQALHAIWGEVDQDLAESEVAKDAAIDAINALRRDTLALLERLD